MRDSLFLCKSSTMRYWLVRSCCGCYYTTTASFRPLPPTWNKCIFVKSKLLATDCDCGIQSGSSGSGSIMIIHLADCGAVIGAVACRRGVLVLEAKWRPVTTVGKQN